MVKTRIFCCPDHPNAEYATQSALNKHLKKHDRLPRFKKPRNLDRHKQGACPFCNHIGGKHLARHIQQRHGQVKGKTLTPSFAQLDQWENMKAIEKARKQEQMSTDGQSMASTVPFTPEDGSWLLAVSEEQPEAGAGLTGTQVGGQLQPMAAGGQQQPKAASGGSYSTDFHFSKEKPGKVEALMTEAGIRYEDFHSPADYSSDEEEIARAQAILAEDVRAALEAFNLGCRKRLVRNARRESLDEGYSSEVDSD